MKAISLWQPWASLWLTDRKIHETRHWLTRHRGWLAVHAAKRFEKNFGLDDPLRAILDDEFGGHWGIDLPVGAIVGIVHLDACWKTDDMAWPMVSPDDYVCGDFSPGRFAWQRGLCRVLPRPIPFRGAQGIFEVPDEVFASSEPA